MLTHDSRGVNRRSGTTRHDTRTPGAVERRVGPRAHAHPNQTHRPHDFLHVAVARKHAVHPIPPSIPGRTSAVPIRNRAHGAGHSAGMET